MTSFAEAVLPCLQIDGKVYVRMSKLAVELLKEFDNRSGAYRQAIPNENFLDMLACYLLSHKDKPGFTEKNRNAYLKIVIKRMTKYVNTVMEAARKTRQQEEAAAKITAKEEKTEPSEPEGDK